MDVSSVIYLAGLVDGDGSIFISRRNDRSGYHHGKYRLFLSVSNQNKDLLDHLGGIWERARVYWQATNYRAGRISWEGPKAQEVIKLLESYLVGKKKQAQLALSFPCTGKGNYTEESQALQENLFALMREANQKWSKGKTRKDVLCADLI
jgi:hypothetical protein